MKKLIIIVAPSLLLFFIGIFMYGSNNPTAASSNGESRDTQAISQAVPANLSLRFYESGFAAPVAIVSTGVAGDERLYIVEKGGIIRIIDRSQVISYNNPFLDITAKVDAVQPEKGLLGLAFDPDFATNRFFYVAYTTPTAAGETDFEYVIERYTVSANENLADPLSAFPVFRYPQTRPFHNGGNLVFGPDGYLYVGMGDDTKRGSVQDLDLLLGKMLRIDVDLNSTTSLPSECDSLAGNYLVPADNPYVGQTISDGVNTINPCDEIWAYGLRNPWRYGFDSETGDLYIGDVGANEREELSFQPASSIGGENYGWDIFEGTLCNTADYDQATCDGLPNYVPPIYDYPHDFETGGYSVIAGYVYRGSRYPRFAGDHIFLDYSTARFWRTRNDGAGWQTEGLGSFNAQTGLISTMGQDIHGNLYVASISKGEIYEVVEDYGFDITLSGPTFAIAGSEVEYSLIVTNQGAETATDLVVSNQLPLGIGFGEAVGGNFDGTQVWWELGQLGSTETVTLTWTGVNNLSVAASENMTYSVSSAEIGPIFGDETVTTVFGNDPSATPTPSPTAVGPIPTETPGSTAEPTMTSTGAVFPPTATAPAATATLPPGVTPSPSPTRDPSLPPTPTLPANFFPTSTPFPTSLPQFTEFIFLPFFAAD